MTAFPCEFYGGPLAGQVHAIGDPPTRYRVPSFTRPRYFVESASAPPVPLEYEYEEYELGPGRGDCPYAYTWINPAKALREHVGVLRDSIAILEEKNGDLKRRLAEVQKDANRWKTVQGALRTLRAEL